MTKKLTKGLIQIYTGDGKGKTTAALGLALRATGRKLKVIFIQFVKGVTSGEHIFVKKYLPFEIVQTSKGDCFKKTKEKLSNEAMQTLEYAREQMLSNKYDVIILDEIFVAVDQEYVGVKDILNLLECKPKAVELVMTGRNAPQEIIEKADLVTEMRMIKHPFCKGIAGRIGIEY